MARDVSNSEDVLDSRDILERIEELESELEGSVADTAAGTITSADGETDLTAEAAELLALKALADEAEPYCPDWIHGATLIRDSYFKEYAEELADDIGAINKDQTWPNNCIDWDEAARQLQQDYTSVDFDGITYWVR